MSTAEGSVPHVRIRDRLAVWGFCIFWLLPMIYIAATRRAPPLPRAWAELTNVTCLFTRAQPTWSVFFVQVRTSTHGHWIELDTRPYFGLEPFGHRTRLDRYLLAWIDPTNEPARDELARWLVQEHRRRHPDAPAIVELRFLVASIGIREDRPPSGAWNRPPLGGIPPNHRRVLSTHAVLSDP